MIRPATTPTKLRDGYYIEIATSNPITGIKRFRQAKRSVTPLHRRRGRGRRKNATVLVKMNSAKMETIPELQNPVFRATEE